MARERTLVTPRMRGMKFGMDAANYNAMVNASRFVRDHYPDGLIQEREGGPWGTHGNVEIVSAGTYLDWGQVMGLGAPAISTWDDAGYWNEDLLFTEGPNFNGEEPDQAKHWGKAGIMFDPAETNEFMRAHLDSIAITRVRLEDDYTDFCDVADGDNYLNGHWSGSWHILWRDTNVATPNLIWCIVCKKGPWQRVLHVETVDAIGWNGSGSAKVFINGVDTGETITVHHNWSAPSAQQTIPAGIMIDAQWMWDKLEWVVAGTPTSGELSNASRFIADRTGGSELTDTSGFGVPPVYVKIPLVENGYQSADITLNAGSIQFGSAGLYRIGYHVRIGEDIASLATSNVSTMRAVQWDFVFSPQGVSRFPGPICWQQEVPLYMTEADIPFATTAGSATFRCPGFSTGAVNFLDVNAGEIWDFEYNLGSQYALDVPVVVEAFASRMTTILEAQT